MDSLYQFEIRIDMYVLIYNITNEIQSVCINYDLM